MVTAGTGKPVRRPPNGSEAGAAGVTFVSRRKPISRLIVTAPWRCGDFSVTRGLWVCVLGLTPVLSGEIMHQRTSWTFLRVRSVLVTVLFLAGAEAALFAQATQPGTVTISGRVISQATGLGVPNSTVTVAVLGLTGTSDLSGNFTIPGVPAGTADLVAMRTGFQTSTVTGISLTAGQVSVVEIPMNPADADDVLQMEAFTISAQLVQGSQIGLALTRQNSASVSDSIGSDLFGRLSIGDAAEAMSKVTGASIVDGKHIFIRGLGDRYTNTQLNNSTMPSADPDRRSVQMDQFPSDLIESVTTLKSFTPDQPGAFSGGSVNIKTKPFPERFFVSTSAKVGYNSQTTGKEVIMIPGGGRDWTGMDDGTRELPAGLATPFNITLTAARFSPELATQLDQGSRSFNNTAFFPKPEKAKPDMGLSLSFGDRLVLPNEDVLGYIVSLNYDRSTRYYDQATRARYAQGGGPADEEFISLQRVFTTDVSTYSFDGLYAANPNIPGGTPAFGITQTTKSVNWGAYLQTAWQPSTNHELVLNLFHNQSAEDSIRRGVGEAVRSDNSQLRESYDLLYTERGISSAQLSGKSNLTNLNDATLEWRASVNQSTQDQPDYRTFEFKWDFVFQAYNNTQGVSNRRYFRELEDGNEDFGIDLTLPYTLGDRGDLSIKTGLAYTDGDRTNREREFSIENTPNIGRATLDTYPGKVGLISAPGAPQTFGTVMREITGNLNYDGTQTFTAAYAMGDWRVNDRWRVIGGARFERTEILTKPLPQANLTPRIGEVAQNDALPAIAAVFSPGEKSNWRVSYGRTLARPTYRELSDVTVYDGFNDEFLGGNTDLEVTLIDNLDLRWEFFPRGSEIIAASLFYKSLQNPIEYQDSQGRILPQNVEDGVVYGLELEFRRSLEFIGESFENISIGINGSIIESEVTIPEAELAQIRAAFPDADGKRELYGQSPYLINIDTTYEARSWGSVFSLAYNINGERLSLVNSGPLPDVYEQPAPSLDFSYSQRLHDRWKMKFSARNLLDPDKEKLSTFKGRDYIYDRSAAGRSFSVSVSYEFN